MLRHTFSAGTFGTTQRAAQRDLRAEMAAADGDVCEDHSSQVSGDDEGFMTPEQGPGSPATESDLPPAVGFAAAPKADTRRQYKGSYNYVQFFNREVEEFFSKTQETFGILGRKLDPALYVHSKVNCKGDIVYDEVPFRRRYREFCGSVWTPLQKAIFFKSVGRHSIHQIDGIREDLGFSKTAAEIYAYYQGLRRDLRYLKRKRNKVRVEINSTTSKYRYFRGNTKLVSYQEMPIAYEMSDNFVVVDESQAQHMNMREKIRQNDDKRHFLPFMNEMLRAQDHLFDLDVLEKLTQYYYDHGVLERQARSDLKLAYKSYVLLEELVKSLLRKIILNLSGCDVVTPRALAVVIHNLRLLDRNRLRYLRDDYLYKLAGRDYKKKRATFCQIMHEPKYVEPFILEAAPPPEPQHHAVLDISQLPKMKQHNDPNIEEIIETRALNSELTALNRSDAAVSANYEHILLTWLTTANPTKNRLAAVGSAHQHALAKWSADRFQGKVLSKVKKYQRKDKFRPLSLWRLGDFFDGGPEERAKESGHETFHLDGDEVDFRVPNSIQTSFAYSYATYE